jgi:hypothetical protein
VRSIPDNDYLIQASMQLLVAKRSILPAVEKNVIVSVKTSDIDIETAFLQPKPNLSLYC